MIASIILFLVELYIGCGLLFAIPFLWLGVGCVDPHAARGSWGFRIVLIPGTVFFWPMLAQRWVHAGHGEKHSGRHGERA
ncbi:MAG: hypothetical protein U1G07_26550 [Verrucomicrobiota bacterium]